MRPTGGLPTKVEGYALDMILEEMDWLTPAMKVRETCSSQGSGRLRPASRLGPDIIEVRVGPLCIQKGRGGAKPPPSFLNEAKRGHMNIDDVRPQPGHRSQTARTLARAHLAYRCRSCGPLLTRASRTARCGRSLRGTSHVGDEVQTHAGLIPRT